MAKKKKKKDKSMEKSLANIGIKVIDLHMLTSLWKLDRAKSYYEGQNSIQEKGEL